MYEENVVCCIYSCKHMFYVFIVHEWQWNIHMDVVDMFIFVWKILLVTEYFFGSFHTQNRTLEHEEIIVYWTITTCRCRKNTKWNKILIFQLRSMMIEIGLTMKVKLRSVIQNLYVVVDMELFRFCLEFSFQLWWTRRLQESSKPEIWPKRLS